MRGEYWQNRFPGAGVEDHPRLRGEYCYPISNSAELLGSPPLARGIRGYYVILFSDERITPACAGNTLKSDDFGALLKDHPRLRGEYIMNLLTF